MYAIRSYYDKAPLFELGQRIPVRLKEAIEATRSLIATLAEPLDLTLPTEDQAQEPQEGQPEPTPAEQPL